MRKSGVLLHITSLPSPYGIGDLGPSAYRFVDFLFESNQSLWQILPLTPIDAGRKNSPYNSSSAFAGNKYLISPEKLLKKRWIDEKDLHPIPDFPENKVDYSKVSEYKDSLLRKTYETFKEEEDKKVIFDFQDFCYINDEIWLDDFATYTVFRHHFDYKPLHEWPKKIRDRDTDSIKNLKNNLEKDIEREKFYQFLFFDQWLELKTYCNQKGIQILGDLPFYIDYNSADVWVNPELFKLDDDKKPIFVSGVPPDYFSETGQKWGNPIYNWSVHKEKDYYWWTQRIKHNLDLFDIIRIDHFRGFEAHWEINADENDATNGKWVKGPREDFFNHLLKKFYRLPIFAEDLGVITSEVRELINKYNFPGMKILQFAFDENLPTNPYIPHNLKPNCILYTGTHDNNTIIGWYKEEINEEVKRRISDYIGAEVDKNNVNWKMIRLAMKSVANYVIFPMQDIMSLGAEYRMNTPSKADGNWEWKMNEKQQLEEYSKKLGHMTKIYNRI
ncbi:MAG: 4-alpha-glucanotransferase [Candidatus Thermoplasmatota archaeon]